MKVLKNAGAALPVLAAMIAIVFSAFTVKPESHFATTTVFANENNSVASISVGQTVPSTYVNVSTAVVTAGSFEEYVHNHCPSPITIVCVVKTTESNDKAIVETIADGTWTSR